MSTRTTDRFVATTHHITERQVTQQHGDLSSYNDYGTFEEWEAIDTLDTGLVVSLRHRITPVDFSEDSF